MSRTTSPKRQKPGPKPKVTADVKATVLGVVGTGGSIADAADIVGMSRRTIQNAMRSDPDFFAGVKRAKKSGKMRLIQRVTSAKAWQAAAWMLERMYGAEFGKRERVEHSGPGGRAIKTEHEQKHTVDYDAIETELAKLSTRMAGRVASNGNAQPVHPD